MAHSHHHPSRALSQDELEARRIKAAGYFSNGKAQAWVCAKFGVSRAAVCQWHAKWKESGRKGLLKRKYGKPSHLSPAQERQLQKDILQGALKCGYDTDCWTLRRLSAYIKKTTGVVYRDRSVWHTMLRFGFSSQIPK